MSFIIWIVGIILALAWVSRVVSAALGMPKIPDISKPEWDRKPHNLPRVTIVVPARNEEETIAPALSKLLVLDYDNYEIIAVNDRSTDRTGELMESVAAGSSGAHGRLRVLHVDALPFGW